MEKNQQNTYIVNCSMSNFQVQCISALKFHLLFTNCVCIRLIYPERLQSLMWKHISVWFLKKSAHIQKYYEKTNSYSPMKPGTSLYSNSRRKFHRLSCAIRRGYCIWIKSHNTGDWNFSLHRSKVEIEFDLTNSFL